MNKIKMRCSVCGKSFKSANPKQVMCDPCEAKTRREKSKHPKTAVPVQAARPLNYTLPPMTGTAPSAPAEETTPLTAATSSRTESRPRRRPRPAPRPDAPAGGPTGRRPASSVRPARHPAEHPSPKPSRQPAGSQRQKRPPAPSKPKEPRSPTLPFMPTPEQVAAIERRYLELANPTEYDGIRTQIARELQIPKTAVKKVVHALRMRLHMPSWWDLQGYHGSPEDLERIRQLYLPYLPVPPIGIHRIIAEQLHMSAGTVYQGIKAIRAEMNLPQYNPPELHADELQAQMSASPPALPIDTAESDRSAQSKAAEVSRPGEANLS